MKTVMVNDFRTSTNGERCVIILGGPIEHDGLWVGTKREFVVVVSVGNAAVAAVVVADVALRRGGGGGIVWLLCCAVL